MAGRRRQAAPANLTGPAHHKAAADTAAAGEVVHMELAEVVGVEPETGGSRREPVSPAAGPVGGLGTAQSTSDAAVPMQPPVNTNELLARVEFADGSYELYRELAEDV